MALKCTALLLVFFLTLLAPSAGQSQSGQYQCKRLHQLTNCGTDSRVRVLKTEDDYQLELCLNNQCTTFNSRIKCKDVCDFCQSLLGSNECGILRTDQCEERVDSFLNAYCASVMLCNRTTTPSVQTAGITHTQPMFTATKTIVVTVTNCKLGVFNEATNTHLEAEIATRASVISPSCSQPDTVSVMPSILPEDRSVLRSKVNTAPVVLGALLGFSLLLLAVVIAGWVCTCCLHKKDSEIPYRRETPNASYHEELMQNPAYAVTSILRSKDEISQQGTYDTGGLRYNLIS